MLETQTFPVEGPGPTPEMSGTVKEGGMEG